MEKPERKDLIKISDYIWEIPKHFREDMKVPARIFAEEKMLDDILEDKSLWQLVNVASLPGIYKYALAMPDIHEGYGACVGSVAAFDYEEGIISPGICGYDINCLHPETKVNLDFGTYLEIKDLKPRFKVYFFDKENKKINSAKILFVLKRKEKEIYKIETKLGNEILITEDHPVYTLDGMKEVRNLILGEKILIYPFKGVKYEKPKRKLILDEKKFIEFCVKNGFNNDGNKLKQILNYLKKRNLLPLYTDSPCLPYILKIFGYALVDGAINNNFSYLSIWGKKEDLEEIKKDLEILGINPLISNRKRRYKLINNYGKEYTFERIEYELRVSKSFALLLCAIGYPFGRKTEKEFLLPNWFKDLRLWQKRLFLAGFLGAELSTPKTFREHKFNFYSLNLNINKNLKLLKNGFKFMNEIRKLLKEFGVETTEIKIIKELGIKGKTVGLRFQIKSNIENLIRFFEIVGFEYNKEKQELNNLALSYLKYKLKIIKQREEIRKKARVLYKLGTPLRELEKIFVGPFINTRFLERSIWENTFNVRVAFNFYNFEEFIKNFNYKNGFLIDKIEKIEKLNYEGYVYDLTIDDKDHNFIANNFVVSNCGVRLAITDLDYEKVKDKIPKLTEEIFKQVPSGVGRGGFWKLNNDEMRKVLENGAQYIVELGYGEKEDLEATESFGKLEGADAEAVYKTAKDRGRDQLGTMGAGNHFVEVQRVSEIYEPLMNADTPLMNADKNIRVNPRENPRLSAAKKLGLEKGKIAVLIHCGSRGLGHQVATDYIRKALNYIDKQNIELPDRELAYFPYRHPEGQNYLSAMKASANFAFANRQLILHQVRKAFKKVFGKEIKLRQVYDVAHNIVKIEEYEGKKLIVHRKGATRAFWKGHPKLSPKYQEIGQPTLIPGSMGTSSYILIGQELAKEISFGSAPHGAGRLMSRAEAKRKVRGSELKKELEKRGISVAAGSMSGLAEEAPVAYKDVSEVVEVVHNIGIAKKLAKLVPVGVIKG
jgi:tRNA-splicing ligase RtcB